jgi:hypothetical protein
MPSAIDGLAMKVAQILEEKYRPSDQQKVNMI